MQSTFATKLIIAALLIVIHHSTDAQVQVDECGFDEVLRTQMESPEFVKALNAGDITASEFYLRGGGTEQITIPVVIHVVHIGDPIGTTYNPSDDALIGIVESSNARFSGLVGDGVNCEISFCLAQIDPWGAPTNGIDRIDGTVYEYYVEEGMAYSTAICNGPTFSRIGLDYHWDVHEYYNIYLVTDFCGGSNWLGFATSIGTTGDYDGIYIRTNYFTADDRTLTHELGHAMGLPHTFNGDQNNTTCPDNSDCSLNGDGVCDTSPHKQTDCAAPNPCDGDNTFWANSFNNYMSYCVSKTLFTEGQKSKMHSLINIYRPELMNSVTCSPDTCVGLSSLFDRNLIVRNLSGNDFSLNWDNRYADQINLRYRNLISSNWLYVDSIQQDSIVLYNLPNCTSFAYQIEVICNSESTGWSESVFWDTEDCISIECDPWPGASNYCNGGGLNFPSNYASYLNLDDQSYELDNPLFEFYYDNFEISLSIPDTHRISLPFAYTQQPTYASIWIDFNRDFTFDDVTEKIFSSSIPIIEIEEFSFVVPNNTITNSTTQMRVVLRPDTEPAPCDVEMDMGTVNFCVSFFHPNLEPDCLETPGGLYNSGSICDDGNPNTVNDQLDVNCNCFGELLDCIGNINGTALPGTSCDDENPNTGNDTWTEDCVCAGDISTSLSSSQSTDILVYYNIETRELNLSLKEQVDTSWSIRNALGQITHSGRFTGMNETISTNKLHPGNYYIVLSTNKVVVRKFIVL